MKALGIIPARGGSKGLPGKHLLSLNGRPMIDWTLQAAQDSQRLAWSILTTDDPDIRARAEPYPKVFGYERSPYLAQDETATEPVIEDVVDFLNGQHADVDTIVLLQPTSPLRTGKEIDEALSILEETGADSVVAVVPSHVFLWVGNVPLYDPLRRPRRQDMGDTYEECGAIYATSLHAWAESGCRISGDIATYVMDEKHRLQVDTRLDLDCIEAVMRSE